PSPPFHHMHEVPRYVLTRTHAGSGCILNWPVTFFELLHWRCAVMSHWWHSHVMGARRLADRLGLRYRPRIEELEDRTVLSTGFVPLAPFTPLGVASASPQHIIGAGDFNGDGKIDLVSANAGTAGTISILTGKGDGRFNPVGTLGSTNSFALT